MRKRSYGKKDSHYSLLRQADFPDQFGVTRIGAQGIHGEVAPEANYVLVMFLECCVEPFEGAFPIARTGIQLSDAVGRSIFSLGLALRQ